jgi:hypothetical protein
MTWRLPGTYHSAGHGRGTATLKFYEGRDILGGPPRYVCHTCGELFSSVSGSDLHKPSKCVTPATVGLVTTEHRDAGSGSTGPGGKPVTGHADGYRAKHRLRGMDTRGTKSLFAFTGLCGWLAPSP